MDRENPAEGALAGRYTGLHPEKGYLFQRSADRGEIGAELTAHTVNGCDDRNRDTGGDQAVFDSGRAGFVGDKVLQNTLQLYLPGSCVGMAQQPEDRLRFLMLLERHRLNLNKRANEGSPARR